MSSIPTVLTIAGSDSGGGAGIQADLKTFTALGVFGTTAITCITAQNPDEVRGVLSIDPAMVALQIKTVCEGFPVAAVKTGMLYASAIIETVVRSVLENRISTLVVDPVMVATSGARLLAEDAVEAMCSHLFPLATVITPNVPELEVLCGCRIVSIDDLRSAAMEAGKKYNVACAAKGGHLEGAEVVDVLYADGDTTVFSSERIHVRETHGTGCTFSAALTAGLAKGKSLKDSVEVARNFVGCALKHFLKTGSHSPLNLTKDI